MNRRDLLKLAPVAAAGLMAGCGSEIGDHPLLASLPTRPPSKAPKQVNVAFLWFETVGDSSSGCYRPIVLRIRPELKVTRANITVRYEPSLILHGIKVPDATIFEDGQSVTLARESHHPFGLNLDVYLDFCFVDGAKGGYVWVADAEFELHPHGEVLWATVLPIWLSAPS